MNIQGNFKQVNIKILDSPSKHIKSNAWKFFWKTLLNTYFKLDSIFFLYNMIILHLPEAAFITIFHEILILLISKICKNLLL